ncbi:MAG: RHS repeat protein [Phycisphaerae bacterium]|nr:RHS repeat protein [Phycisphaerae bacterium]
MFYVTNPNKWVLWGLGAMLLVTLAGIPAMAADNPAIGKDEPNTRPDDGPWDPPCYTPPCEPCNGSGSPVLVSSGTFFKKFVDLAYQPGGALQFDITRTYKSDDFYIGFFGRGTHSTLDMMAIPTFRGNMSQEIVVVRSPDGQRIHFTKQPDDSYMPPVGRDDMLTKVLGGFEYVTPDGIVSQYDEDTKLLSITDPNNNTITFTYDIAGRPETVTLPHDRTITITYSPNGLVSGISDFGGRSVSYEYDESGNLTSHADADNQVWTCEYLDGRLTGCSTPSSDSLFSVTYDEQGRVQRLIDEQGDFTYTYPSSTQTRKTDTITGAIWTYAFHSTGVISNITDPLGGQTAFGYDSAYNLTSERNANNYTAYFSYDDEGRMLSETDPLSNTTSWTYNELGLVETVTDALDVVTCYEYDSYGNLTRLIEAQGDLLQRETFFVYDADGNMLTRTDPAGNSATFEYDQLGNRTRMTDALSNETTYAYDSMGNLTSLTIPDGEWTFGYDALGWRTSIADPLGNTRTAAYDANNRLTTLGDGEEQSTTFAYDLFGRITRRTAPTGSETQCEYDHRGYITRLTDGNNKQTTYGYDLAGRLTLQIDALSQNTSYAYDAVGNRTSLTDPNSHTMAFEYDALGRLTRTTYPDTTFELTAYGPTGLVVSETDRNSQTTTLAYDSFGRLTSRVYPDASMVTYAYDAVGNLTTTANPAAALTFTYNGLGNRLTEANTTWGKTIGYEYDAVGRRTLMTDPEGVSTTYFYDAAGRVTRIAHPSMGEVTYAYDRAGARTARTLPNGTYAAYSYNESQRLLGIEHHKADESLLLSFSYTADNAGIWQTMTDNDGLHEYGYDDLYRQTTATHPNPGVNPNETYGLDPVGNRLSSHLSSSYTHDADNRLLSDDDFTYAYDVVGNLTSRIAKAGGAVTLYGYDAENHLVSVDLPDGSVVAYSYDPLGRRIEKDVDGAVTRFVYAFETIASEYDGANVLLASYLHGPRYDEPLVMRRGGVNHFYHEDGMGSVKLLTDAAEGVVSDYLYDSFGRVLVANEGVANAYTYTGRELDAESGLYHYRARAYTAGVGRFLQTDPIGLEGGLNLYQYALANPVNFLDPTGLDTWSGVGIQAGGFLFFGGYSSWTGLVKNLRTGEQCSIVVRCAQIGGGLGGSIGVEANISFNGASTGFGMSGWGTSAFGGAGIGAGGVGVGGSVNASYDPDSGLSGGGGVSATGGVSLTFSAGGQACRTSVQWCRCPSR